MIKFLKKIKWLLLFVVILLLILSSSKMTASAMTNATVYEGTYNTTVVDLWQGLINNNVGKDYVAFRSSQYDYYIFFGEDFVYNNGRITGEGTYYRYTTTSGYNTDYQYDIGTDSFNVNVNEWYVYSNVTPDFPSLSNERSLLYEQIQIVALCALLLFGVMRWIFLGK